MNDFNEELKRRQQALRNMESAEIAANDQRQAELEEAKRQTDIQHFRWILHFLDIEIPCDSLEVDWYGFKLRLAEWQQESTYDNPYPPRFFPIIEVQYGEAKEQFKLPVSYLFTRTDDRDEKNAVRARAMLAEILLRLKGGDKDYLQQRMDKDPQQRVTMEIIWQCFMDEYQRQSLHVKKTLGEMPLGLDDWLREQLDFAGHRESARITQEAWEQKVRTLKEERYNLSAEAEGMRRDLHDLAMLEGTTDAGEQAQRREILRRYE